MRLVAPAWLAGAVATALSLLDFRISIAAWVLACMAAWAGPLITAGSLAVDHARNGRREGVFLALAAAGVAANMLVLGLMFAVAAWTTGR